MLKQRILLKQLKFIAMSEEASFACHCEPHRGEAIPYNKLSLRAQRGNLKHLL
jgi:hypothetical protein